MPANQVEQQLAAELGEAQTAELVEDNEFHPRAHFDGRTPAPRAATI